VSNAHDPDAVDRAAKAALFGSGIFFGGAIDHAILAMKRSERTPYGVPAGVAGNWLLAALDSALAGAFYALHRRLENGARTARQSLGPRLS
jgi:hypothetical protein